MILPSLNPLSLVFASGVVRQNWLCVDRRVVVPASEQHCHSLRVYCSAIKRNLVCNLVRFLRGVRLVYTMATYKDHTVLPAFAVKNKFILIQYPEKRGSGTSASWWCVTATVDGDVYPESPIPLNEGIYLKS